MCTYQIDDTEDFGPHLTALYVTEVAGRTFATVRAGTQLFEVELGVPLCSGCDETVSDGPCSCEQPV